MPGKGRRLLIVEDELLLLRLLQDEFERLNFEVRTATSVVTARTVIANFDPDIALLDISLEGTLSGIDLGHILARSRPDIAQVYLTKSEESSALPPGAGFVQKQMIGDTDYLIEVIDSTASGRASEPVRVTPAEAFSDLPPRALAVLELLADGASNLAISEKLGFSVKSVERWIDTVYKQFGIEPKATRNARVEAALIYHRTLGTHELPIGPT